MPFLQPKKLMTLNTHSITAESFDTKSLADLHGLWSVLHKCADAMDDGKRLENISWRLFSREAFCCAPELRPARVRSIDRKRHLETDDVPPLSSSVESLSDERLPSRPELVTTSTDCGARKEKHITPVDLEKIVVSIKSKRELTPLSPLPPALMPTKPVELSLRQQPESKPDHITRSERSPSPPRRVPILHIPTELVTDTVAAASHSESQSQSHEYFDSSTSTVTTESDCLEMTPPFAGSDTTNTEVSATSIVRGFSRDKISCSHRSYSQLLPTPTPSGSILKSSLAHRSQAPPAKKKGATFQLGGSSGECDSSFESSYLRGRQSSALGESLRKSTKTTSFNDTVDTLEISSRAFQEAAVFDDSDEEDEESSSAIEDDDVDEDWEDDDEPSIPSSVNEKEMFQRVDSKPTLVSRRSLLTTMMHQGDRAAAMQNAASRSTPAIRRSRTSSPNGPLNSSPPSSIAQGLEHSRARPIIMTTSNTHPPALSPRTTRRNMLSTELTESLRKHLLWDRQVNRQATNAALKRRHTAQDMTKLQTFPGEPPQTAYLAPTLPQSVRHSSRTTNYFDIGLQEYHQKGW